MFRLILLTIWLIVFLICFIKIEWWLIQKSIESFKELKEAYIEVKKSKKELLDFVNKIKEKK